MRRLLFIVLAACASLSVTAVQAQEPVAKGASLAKMTTPFKDEHEAVIDGRIWRCAGADCRAIPAPGARAQSTQRECEGVVRVFGPVGSYQSGAEVLAAEPLARCNGKARKR